MDADRVPNDTLLELLRLCEQSGFAEDSERFAVAHCGPFRAQINLTTSRPQWSMTIPVGPLDDADAAAAGIEEVRRVFRARGRAPRIEFSELRWPSLPALLERAGLRLEERMPMMVCAPEDFRPIAAPGVSLRLLTSRDADATLGAFQMIRLGEKLEGAPPYAPRQAIDRLREDLEAGEEEFALASLDGQVAGTGVCGLQGEVAEVVGIVTVPSLRRRGVAATVTSALVRRFFAHGGRAAWLSAATAGAQAVYARVGFQTVGDWLSYSEAAE